MKSHGTTKEESKAADGAVDQDADNLSEDEEIDEDEAFNSDDERRWGHLFGNTSTSSKKRKIDGDEDDDDDDDVSEEEEDDEGMASEDDNSADGDGGEYMLELLENLDKANKKPEKGSSSHRHSSIPESEFSASVLQGTKLTMDQLMSGISNTQKFSSVVKSVAPVSGSDDGKDKKLSTAKTPASRIVSERAMRKVQYQEQSKNISLWTEAIQENRRAETLDFRCKERLDVTRDRLVSSFTPTTDFEMEIQKALQEAAAATEEDIQKKEQGMVAETEDDDDLGGVTMTLQEFKKRQGELAKFRALMFYEEIKMHHINKIKSKRYRKIRKKQRTNQAQKGIEARLQGGDDELLKELQEKEEMERMKERMTLAHKNTSKWARQQLARKGKMDLDTRRALSEQIRIGDELRRKMNSIRGSMQDDEEDDDDDENNLIDKARQILHETEVDEEKPANGLFKMAFMQRGLQLQRDRAKEEAKKLLEELEGNSKPDKNDNHDSEDSSEDSDDRLTVQPDTVTKSANVTMKPAEETTSSNLPMGKLVANNLQFGNPNSLEISGTINVDICSDNSANAEEAQINKSHFEYNATLRFEDNNKGSTAAGKTGQKILAQNVDETGKKSNPWLLSVEKRNKNKVNKKQQTEVVVDVKEAAFVLPLLNVGLNETQDGKIQSKSFSNSGQTLPSNKSNTRDAAEITTVNLTQEELVRRAFAAPTEAELEEELNQEKDTLKDKGDPTRKVETAQVVKGWGSWAGEGVVAPKHKSKFPKDLKPKMEHIAKQKKDPLKRVILNDRRIKKSIKFQIPHVPYPYRSREEYEKAMAGAIGREWNVTSAVKSMSRPEILTTKGRIIKPLSKKAKMKRAPAKF